MPKTRKDISLSDTWDLEDLYPNPEALEGDIKSIKAALPVIRLYKGKLNTPENVLECMNLMSSVTRMMQKIGNFVENRANEDLGNDENNKRKAELEELAAASSSICAFIDPELAAKSNSFLRPLKNNPDFVDFDFYFTKLMALKKHLLSAESEELLAGFSEVLSSPYKVCGKVRDADMKFPEVKAGRKKVPLTNSSFTRLRQSQNREVRRETTEKFFGTYHGFRNTFSEALRLHIRNNVIDARLRKYSSILDSFLLPRGLTEGVCDTLFATTEKHLHLLHRYCEVRRQKMGLEKLCWHDLYVPLVNSVNNSFTYDEAVSIILKALAPLGKEYVRTIGAGLTTERWVDRYENEGKRSGAYSSGIFDGKPYILMNFEGTLNDVSTLAHEGGHSMHSLLARSAQPFPKYRYMIFLAEIASTLNEIILGEHLLKDADRKLRAFIVNGQLESIRTTFFRQTMFARFETWLYRRLWDGNSFSAGDMEEEYFRLNQLYYGPDVELNPAIKSEWAFIPHFYFNFYVFQYATGIACASYFADRVLSGEPEELENYLNLLRAGGSDYPIVLLKNAGLDIGKPDYLEALMKRFEKLLDEFEEMDLK